MNRSKRRSCGSPVFTGLLAAVCCALPACDSGGGHAGASDAGAGDAKQDVPMGMISIALGDGPNICPVVVLTATPVETRVGQSIGVQAWPSDPDAADAGMSSRLAFTWTTTAGKLSDLSTPQVQLLCTSPGRVVVSLGVSDGQCTTMQTVELHCTATDAGSSEADGGGGSGDDGGAASSGGTSGSGGSSASGGTSGGGSGGATGTGGRSGSGGAPGSGGSSSSSGGTSAATGGGMGSGGMNGSGGSPGTGGHNPNVMPTEDVSMACSQCTMDNCVPDTDGCQIYQGSADRKSCEDAYACFRDSGCLGLDGDPIRCWCGNKHEAGAGDTCLTDNAPPTQANGPCLQQVLKAAQSMDAATVRLRFTDPTFPIGGAVNLMVCRVQFCKYEYEADGFTPILTKPACVISTRN
jgi:hypothetical protein